MGEPANACLPGKVDVKVDEERAVCHS